MNSAGNVVITPHYVPIPNVKIIVEVQGMLRGFNQENRYVNWVYTLSFALALALSGCTGKVGDGKGSISAFSPAPSGSGTGYGGAPPINFIERCGTQSKGTNQYQINCGIFQTSLDGTEVPIDSLKVKPSVVWQNPKTIVGKVPLSLSCEVKESPISQVCNITTENSDSVNLKFDASVTDLNANLTQEVTDTVMLPFMIQTFGFNPKAARQFGGSTASNIPHLQPITSPALQVRLQHSQLCAVNKGTFIADNDMVYLWSSSVTNSPGTMQVFAGSIWTPLSLRSNSDWSNQYRLPFQTKVAIDCKQGPKGADDYILYILSAIPGSTSGSSTLALTTISPLGTSTQFVPTSMPFSGLETRFLRVSSEGKWYFISTSPNSIYELDPSLSTVDKGLKRFLGNGNTGTTVEGGNRLTSLFKTIQSLAFSPKGELYFTDILQQKIFRVDASGIVHTAVGDGTLGSNLNLSHPTQSQLYFPSGISFSQNDLFIGDSTVSRILVLHTSNQTLSAIGGIQAPSADVGSLLAEDVAVHPDGSLWVTYAQGNGSYLSRVAKLQLSFSSPSVAPLLSWVAGALIADADEISTGGSGTDVGLSKQLFSYLSDAALDPKDQSAILVENKSSRLLRAKLGSSGKIEMLPLVGKPFVPLAVTDSGSPDGTLASDAVIHWPVGVTVASDGSVYFTEGTPKKVKKVDPQGVLRVIADLSSFVGPASPVTEAHNLFGIAILTEQSQITDSTGSLVTVPLPTLAVADDESQKVIKLAPTTAQGGYVGSTLINVASLTSVLPSGFQASTTPFLPNLLKTDNQGRLYIGSNAGIYRRDTNGTIIRIAGGGANFDPKYQGIATGTAINPRGMFVTPEGKLYVSDNAAVRIVLIVPDPQNTTGNTYLLSPISAANYSIETCGNGVINGQGSTDQVVIKMESSLSQLCLGQPQALVALDRCQTSFKDFTLFFSESFDTQSLNSILIQATHGCQ